MTDDEVSRLNEAIAGLRQALDAMTDPDGNPYPGMADALDKEEGWLLGYLDDMRWLLRCLERVQMRHAA